MGDGHGRQRETLKDAFEKRSRVRRRNGDVAEKGEAEDAGVEVKKSGEKRKETGGEKRKELKAMQRYMLYSPVGKKKIK